MKSWIENYIDLMIRTRWLGMVGSTAFALVIPLSFFHSQFAIEQAEVTNLSEIYVYNLPRVLTEAGLAMVLLARFWVLARAERTLYFLGPTSWLVVLSYSILYIGYFEGVFLQFGPASQEEGGFRIYDFMSTIPDSIRMGIFAFTTLGFIRMVSTLAVAYFMTPSKFK